jgi:hypothetical protein
VEKGEPLSEAEKWSFGKKTSRVFAVASPGTQEAKRRVYFEK